MAIVATPIKSTLRIVVETGMDETTNLSTKPDL